MVTKPQATLVVVIIRTQIVLPLYTYSGQNKYILSRATYHRAPRYGGVRTWVEGLLAF